MKDYYFNFELRCERKVWPITKETGGTADPSDTIFFK